jgi:hypothetical protein
MAVAVTVDVRLPPLPAGSIAAEELAIKGTQPS